MTIKIDDSQLLGYHTAWLKYNGQNFIKKAIMAKLYASKATMGIVREAVQINERHGYEYDAERFF